MKARLGGRLRHAISGGAALGAELGAFFHALDVLVLEGYGLTECAVVSVNQPGRVKWGTIGPPLPGVEARLADDGELLVRAGQVFGGYHADPAGTAEVLDADGWLHTGDVVEQDADGFSITDRKRDIIVLAGGKNVAPQRVEAAPEPRRRSRARSSSATGGRTWWRSWSRSRASAADVQAPPTRRTPARPGERVRRHLVLAQTSARRRSELTPTLKLRRRVVQSRHAEAIERLYAGSRAEG
ncbi:MAG: AMP-binding protein [Thermoleophilia bacterium]